MPRMTRDKLSQALLVRMTEADKKLVVELSQEWGCSESGVVRLGIELCKKLRRQRLARRGRRTQS